MKKYLLLFLLVSAFGFSQPISQYQYVIVPAKFDAQKKPGQFGLNNLTKLFLEKNGYTVFYDSDILPPNVSGESCNKIYANVFSDNSLRTTRLRVEIKDCRNAVLFVSNYGESMEKDNNVAFNQALRAAFKSFDKPEFRYDPAKKPETKVTEAVAPVKTPQFETNAPKGFQTSGASSEAIVLNAQPIATGYQLIDTTPKIVMRIHKTSDPEVFIAENGTDNGVVLKKDGQWIFEYYVQKVRIAKPLNIKF